jgi:hypothetical protein
VIATDCRVPRRWLSTRLCRAISGPLSTANYGHSRYLPSTFRRLKPRVSAA